MPLPLISLVENTLHEVTASKNPFITRLPLTMPASGYNLRPTTEGTDKVSNFYSSTEDALRGFADDYLITGLSKPPAQPVCCIAWLAADDFIQPFNDKIELFW